MTNLWDVRSAVNRECRLDDTDALLMKLRDAYVELRDEHCDKAGSDAIYDMAVQGIKKVTEMQHVVCDLRTAEKENK